MMHVVSLFDLSLMSTLRLLGRLAGAQTQGGVLRTDPHWPAGCACGRANHLTALNAAAGTVELDSSQNRERCQVRKATLPLSTRPLELLSGLETEQGCCQLPEGPFACRFSIQRTRSPRGITLYKKEIFKVQRDLAFLSPSVSFALAGGVILLAVFFLRNHGHEELLSWLLNQILTTAPPTWRAKDVGETTPMESLGFLLWLAGAGLCKERV